MELQRCVWRCLANSSGNNSPEYHQCVERMCAPASQSGQHGGYGQQPGAGLAGVWATGVAADGYTRFAGLNAQDGSGRGFYYVCSPNAESYLMLAGTGHPAGYFQVQIDGRGFQLPFVQQGDQLTLGILPYAEFLNLLARGRHLAVTNSAGIPVLQLSLAGAARAIPEARSGCGY